MSGADVNWMYSLNTYVSKGQQSRAVHLKFVDSVTEQTNHVSLLNLDLIYLMCSWFSPCKNIVKPSGIVLVEVCLSGTKCRDVDSEAMSIVKQWRLGTF